MSMRASGCGRLSAAVLLSLAMPPAWAGCGAGFCALNPDWDVQGLWAASGTRLDLRYEYLDQDQPRHGTQAVAVGQIPAHHDEVSTLNRNLVASLDINASARWGFSLSLPLVDRVHRHIHHHAGAAHPERWAFREPGDLTALVRYRAPQQFSNRMRGVKLGLKLPTGRTDVVNASAAPAERSLQPGTGSTDAILGISHQDGFGTAGIWFAALTYQRAVAHDEDYRPGEEVRLDLGLSHPLTGGLRGLLQLNAKYRGRDDGAAAEPDNTGGRFAYLSPGLSYGFGRYRLYGFAQLPLYEYVNGVQLTADWGATLGLSMQL